MGLLSKLDALAERYINHYDKNIAPHVPMTNFPKCVFCGARDRNYIAGHPTMVNSRIKTARVRVTVQCVTCGMRYQASRWPDSKRWTFNEPM